MSAKRKLTHSVYNQKRLKTGSTFSNEENDIQSALTELISYFPIEVFQHRLPPIIMRHQLYSLVLNRTFVDKQLNVMKANHEIRIFKLGEGSEEYAILKLDDYKQHVIECCNQTPVIKKFLKEVILKCPDLSYTREVLKTTYNFKEEAIRELMNNGLLTTRDIGCYWLALPRAGEFIKALDAGRKALILAIKRTSYKEMLESELLDRKPPKAVKLGIKYHLHDMIGKELVKCMNTSSGRLLRLSVD